MKESVCLISLGCPKNLVDSEVILGLLSRAGYPLMTDPSEAKILIVNTCSFIEEATKESLQTILQLARYKKEGACRSLVVSGCLPQRYGRRLKKELPEVDLFVGTGSFQKLPELLDKAAGRRPKSLLSGLTFLYDEHTPRILSTPSFMAYLKIAEGCFRRCTFCTVPKIRGPYQSRTSQSILDEAESLADQGVRELILVAQDSTAYGRDLQDGTNLERLLKSLVKVEGLRWIRMLYAYPKIGYFSKPFLEWMAGEEKICPYLDLPIQHIDDEILKRMGRGSRRKEIENLIQRIKKFFPSASLRTTLIVGFPGEKEVQFQRLLNFVGETEFDHLGAFTYSPEEGTPASRLSDQIPEDVKKERLKMLLNLQQGISLKKYTQMVGKKVEVLVEGPEGKKGRLKGRLKTQAPEIDGGVFLKGEAKPGEYVEAQITNAFPYDLEARIKRHLC